ASVRTEVVLTIPGWMVAWSIALGFPCLPDSSRLVHLHSRPPHSLVHDLRHVLREHAQRVLRTVASLHAPIAVSCDRTPNVHRNLSLAKQGDDRVSPRVKHLTLIRDQPSRPPSVSLPCC